MVQASIPRKRNLLYEMLLRLSGIKKRVTLSDEEIQEKTTTLQNEYLPFLTSFPNFIKAFIREVHHHLEDNIRIAEIENKEILEPIYQEIKSLELQDTDLEEEYTKLLNLINSQLQILKEFEPEQEVIISDADQLLQYLLIAFNRIDKKLGKLQQSEPSEQIADYQSLVSRVREILTLLSDFDVIKNNVEELNTRIKSINSELKYKEASFSFALINRGFKQGNIPLKKYITLLGTKVRAEIIRATMILTLKKFGKQTLEQIKERTAIDSRELLTNCMTLLDRQELTITESGHKNLYGTLIEYPKLYRFLSKGIMKLKKNKDKFPVISRSLLNAILAMSNGMLEKILKIGPKTDKIYDEEFQNLTDTLDKIFKSFKPLDSSQEREIKNYRIQALIELYNMFRVKMVHEKEPYLVEPSHQEQRMQQLDNFLLTAMRMDFERGLLLSILRKKGPASIKNLAEWSGLSEKKVVSHILKMLKDKKMLTKGTKDDYFLYDVSRTLTDLEIQFVNTCNPFIGLIKSFKNLPIAGDLTVQQISPLVNVFHRMSENLRKLIEINFDSKIKEELQSQLLITNSILNRGLAFEEMLPKTRSKFDLTKLAMMSLPRIDEEHAGIIDPEYLVGFGDIEWDINKCLACASCQEICPESAVNLVNEWDLPATFEMSEEDLENLPENRRKLIQLIKNLAVKKPDKSIKLPENTLGFGKVDYNPLICIACRKCEDRCPNSALTFHEYWNFPAIMKNLLEEG